MANARDGTRLRPIIRLFVSSTFSDLKLERDALQQRVFPKLEQRCLRDGFQFQAIDLRWGVSSEAGLDHRTMRICFEELRRSQEVSPEPNFLILLGNRYGWRPLPEEISADEFRRLEEAAGQIGVAGQNQSPVDVLRRWYQIDENSLTPIYILQPRRRPKDDDRGGKDYTSAEAWHEVEQLLWQIINWAFPPDGLKDRFAPPPPTTGTLPCIVRFQASATEQEIWCGALSVPDASQHVLAFFREIDQPHNIGDAGQFREFFDVASGQIDPVPQAALRDLKEEIKRRLGNNAIELPPAHLCPAKDRGGPATVSTDHLDTLCGEVESRLTAVIERQIAEYWEPQQSDHVDDEPSTDRRSARELEIERDEHLRFGNERGPKETFVGREDLLKRILAYIENDLPWPLVVRGGSGSGKTALLARAFQEIPARKKPIIRFIGVTPRSSDLRSLLTSLCRELRESRGPLREPTSSNPTNDAAHPSAEIHDLIQKFRQHLQAATAEQPIVLFLDALDQLAEADNGRQLFWLPSGELPSHVKIVVSCLSDRDEGDPVGQPNAALRRRGLPAGNILNLDALALDDAKTLLFNRWLRNAGRTVNESQRRMIEEPLESAAACRQPLYLKLLFEEAKLWRSYNEPAQPGDSVSELLAQLCTRLSRPENHGESLVRCVLGYLAAARRGLSETEILEVLFADSDYKQELKEASRRTKHTLPSEPPRIPIAIWSRLRSDLAPYLTERAAPGGNVLTFYHRQLAEWVKKRSPEDADNRKPQECLAEYFKKQDCFLHSSEDISDQAGRVVGETGIANARKLDELPWQLIKIAKRLGLTGRGSAPWEDVASLLCDMRFVAAKCAAEMVDELLGDFNELTRGLGGDHRQAQLHVQSRRYAKELASFSRKTVALWKGNRITDETARLQCPVLTFAESADEANLQSPPRQSPDDMCVRSETQSTDDRARAFKRFVATHRQQLTDAPDETLSIAHNHAQSGPVVEDANALLAPSPRIWIRREPRSQPLPDRPACTQLFQSPSPGALSLDGELLLFVDSNATFRLWNLVEQLCVAHFPALGSQFEYLQLAADGTLALSVTREGAARVVEMETGGEVTAFWMPSGVTSLAFSPDGGLIVSGNYDGILRAWDASTGRLIGELKVHEGGVDSLAMMADAQVVYSGGHDKTLQMSNIFAGVRMASVGPFPSPVLGLAVTPDGRHGVSASWGNVVRLWDFAKGKSIHELHGHDEQFRCAAISCDGRVAVTASESHKTSEFPIRVWDFRSGQGLRRLTGHTAEIKSLNLSADGRLAVSSSRDGSIRIWDLEATLTAKERHHAEVNPVTPSWRDEVDDKHGHQGCCATIATTIDGRLAASGSDNFEKPSTDGRVLLWDLDSAKKLGSLNGHTGGIRSLSIGPLTDLIVATGTLYPTQAHPVSRYTMRIWSRTKKWLAREIVHPNKSWFEDVAVTPNGRYAVTISEDALLRVWRLSTGRCVSSIRSGAGKHAFPRLIKVLPDGATAVTSAGEDGKISRIEIWRCHPRLSCLGGFEMPGRVESLTSTPDGRFVLFGADDGIIRLWDVRERRQLNDMIGHDGRISGLAVTPDGTHLVSGSFDGTVRAWDLSRSGRGSQRRALTVCFCDAPVSCVSSVSAAGIFATGTSDGYVHVHTIVNRPTNMPVVTAVRFSEPEYEGPGRARSQGIFPSPAAPLTFFCPLCRTRRRVPRGIADCLSDTRESGWWARWVGRFHRVFDARPRGILNLLDGAWEESRLLDKCSECGNTLRFNPFTA